MAPVTTTNVQVALRIRPITPQDAVSIPARFQRIVIHGTTDTSVTVDAVTSTPSGGAAGNTPAAPTAANKKQAFSFDHVHDADASQHGVYASTAEPLIARFMEGFNCTVLAYGQTSSGKTHTMTGVDLEGDPDDPDNGMGIIPRSIAEIFSRIEEMKKEKRGGWTAALKGSFIELYNEDLIDLLAGDDTDVRREVQIREDKDGHIIWGGLREIPVKTVGEVMSLIRQGTSIRRTNETQMNAQSSRSHAIFSLTLTQKRYNGSGPPPRSSSPLPAQNSPSRIGRPGSTYGTSSSSTLIGSPTFGRPPTPSFQSAMHRGQQHLRPHSSLGHNEDQRQSTSTLLGGEWTTITSKFHFVDLAGSERLKRTAAAGERIKEGISINSGLLALGNVISALGDPSKSKVTTHVPYRDSKLTRLLQDSLGGNAHTLMIACVSPVEWNVGETVNTLKYANRARNIRNRARVDEREEGWEDVEWLQAAVIRLRKELKIIREGGEILASDSYQSTFGTNEGISNAAKQVREQLADLQTQYVELRQKYTDRTEELTRLRREAGESIRMSGGSMGAGTGRYEEIVGPVIEEYEKTISAMEAELSLNRAALRHTNDLLTEKEDELAGEVERHAVTEAYLEELRTRVGKLSERESSTEAYIQDLEEKIKGFASSSVATSGSLSSLQKELARHKELEGTNTTYIANLESRLGKSEENILELRHAIDQAESRHAMRVEEIKVLEQKLDRMRGDEQGWRTDLELREQRVHDLETSLKEWESKREESSRERERLGGIVYGVEDAKRSLEDVSKTPSVTEEQLRDLHLTHTATLADLSSVSEKYHDALREISDLAAQLQELKLHQQPQPADASDPTETTQIIKRRKPSVSRNHSVDSTAEPLSPTSSGFQRRGFLIQAASTDSLRARSLLQSPSLSQELSSARSQPRLMASHGIRHQRSESMLNGRVRDRPDLTVRVPEFNSGTAYNERTIPSLEQEIMRLQDALKEREVEISTLEKTLQGSGSMASTLVSSEIDDAPKLSPTTLEQFSALRTSFVEEHPGNKLDPVTSSKEGSAERLDELMRSMAQKESRHREVVEDLTGQLLSIRRQHDDLTKLSRDQALNMSNELESLRTKHDDMASDLTALQERDTQLTASIKVAQQAHLEQIEDTRRLHADALSQKGREISTLQEKLQTATTASDQFTTLRSELADAKDALARAQRDHEVAFGEVHATHEERLEEIRSTADSKASQMKSDHESLLASERAQHEAQLNAEKELAAKALHRNDEQYYTALSKFRTQHEEELQRKEDEWTLELESVRADLASYKEQVDIVSQASQSESEDDSSEAITKLQAAHEQETERKQQEYSGNLTRLKEEHDRALNGQIQDHGLRIERLRADHDTATSLLNERLSSEVEKLSKLLSDHQEDSEVSLSALRDTHGRELQLAKDESEAAVATLAQEHQAELLRLGDSHSKSLQDTTTSHTTQLQQIAREHAEDLARLRTSHQSAIADLQQSLVQKEMEHRDLAEKMRTEHQQSVEEEQKRGKALVSQMHDEQEAERSVWKRDRELLNQEVGSLKTLTLRHDEEVAHMTSVHKTALDERDKELSFHRQAAKDASEQHGELSKQLALLKSDHDEMRSSHTRLTDAYDKLQSSSTESAKVRDDESVALKDKFQKALDKVAQLTTEKTQNESSIRELQFKLMNVPTRSLSPPAGAGRNMERTLSYPRPNGLPPAKLPPLSPPPSIPPPPLPITQSSMLSDSGHSTHSPTSPLGRQSFGSLDTHETAATPTTAVNGSMHSEDVLQKMQAQIRLMEEQEAMIKTLNKQLAHCEGDLQSNIDLVSTLEASLNDSERNLRKARNQANELTRERDSLNRQVEGARNQLQDAQRDAATARQSVIEQKQSMEQRLEEERRAKDRARAQLDARMEELQKRKSKFACM